MNRNTSIPLVQSKLVLIWVVFMYTMIAVTRVADNATKKRSQPHFDGLETDVWNTRFETIGAFRDA